jgi:hypothetical protein
MTVRNFRKLRTVDMRGASVSHGKISPARGRANAGGRGLRPALGSNRLQRRRAPRPAGQERHPEHPPDPGRRASGAPPAPAREPALAFRLAMGERRCTISIEMHDSQVMRPLPAHRLSYDRRICPGQYPRTVPKRPAGRAPGRRLCQGLFGESLRGSWRPHRAAEGWSTDSNPAPFSW